MRLLLLLGTVVLLSFLANSANAQEMPPAGNQSPYGAQQLENGEGSGYERHDGFLVRLQLGFGGMSMVADTDPELRIGGPSGAFRLALGGALSDSWVLFGELAADAVVDPTVEVGATELSTTDTTVSTDALGVGVSHYFDNNMFVGATLSGFNLTVEFEGRQTGESAVGGAITLSLGKEWWVSPDWGLGLAGNFFYGSAADNESADSATWTVTALTVGLSATYN